MLSSIQRVSTGSVRSVIDSNGHLRLGSLTLIIPAYNDETTVGRLIRDANAVLKEICNDYEIIVVNDGSKDNTLAVLQEAAQEIPQVRVINHEVNKGFGYTIRELYYAGTKEFVLSLPGDYQYAPKELLKMAPALDRHDFVIGLRVHRNDPWRRKVQSNVYNFLLRVIYGIRHKDMNSIKLFRRTILSAFELESATAFVDAELCIRAEKVGYRIIEVPIEHLPRLSQGASGGKLSVIWATFADVFKMHQVI